MSIKGDGGDDARHIDSQDTLTLILIELKLISARLEEGSETGLELEDIDHDDS